MNDLRKHARRVPKPEHRKLLIVRWLRLGWFAAYRKLQHNTEFGSVTNFSAGRTGQSSFRNGGPPPTSISLQHRLAVPDNTLQDRSLRCEEDNSAQHSNAAPVPSLFQLPIILALWHKPLGSGSLRQISWSPLLLPCLRLEICEFWAIFNDFGIIFKKSPVISPVFFFWPPNMCGMQTHADLSPSEIRR